MIIFVFGFSGRSLGQAFWVRQSGVRIEVPLTTFVALCALTFSSIGVVFNVEVLKLLGSINLHKSFWLLVVLAHYDAQDICKLLPHEDPDLSQIHIDPKDQIRVRAGVVAQHFWFAGGKSEFLDILDGLVEAVGERCFLEEELIYLLVLL